MTALEDNEAFELLNDKAVEQIVYSNLGLVTLNDCVKSSIANAKEIIIFLKKQSSIYEDYSRNLGRLSKSTKDTFKHTQLQTSFHNVMSSMITFHEDISQNASLYARASEKSSNEFADFLKASEKKRKSIKEYAKKQEFVYTDAMSQLEKATARFKVAEQDYNRATEIKTGEKKPLSFVFNKKSNAQLLKHEDDTRVKVEMAETDLASKTENAKSVQRELLLIHRPNYVKRFLSLLREIDAALRAHMIRYTRLSESYVLHNGLTLRPQPTSISKQAMQDIFNDLNMTGDIRSYLLWSAEKNKSISNAADAANTNIVLPISTLKAMPGSELTLGGASAAGQSAERLPDSAQAAMLASPPKPNALLYNGSASGRNSLRSSAFSTSESLSETLATVPNTIAASTTPVHSTAGTPEKPATSKFFGVHLEALLLREHANVPSIVRICTTVVEKHGLMLEGLYRVSGSTAKINHYKSLFENGDPEMLISETLEPTEVYSIADMLKSFFHNLAESLIPDSHRQDFVRAGNVEDEARRRDAVHKVVNDLPDANYSVVRHMSIHLAKVKECPNVKMSTHNLAIIWGPLLLRDVSIPEKTSFTKVVEILLDYCFTIFD
ncbi:rho-type GTPase activating protein Rga7 [Schizosaccharomyces japonicus yFS275]|uniref:Rho-type GTPase activating protein Rga7 n=2 Tax=Schizosaccharomyces japonicus TaxID=4897 RepID=B6JZS5_SCHJY|nr:rho-type GTPase activating protein Rga7 [Schizosaccharomyces japonicus yFS275]AFM85242.1 Rga7 [Schizosaccharomyces japonicus]EEB06075.1 rho-type GTPase activating protein Rga7 [Schizosaccharomyces japonicus yFS275]